MAEVMGTGILSLPSALASLGWVLGMLISLLFGLAATYAGLLLSHTKHYCYPEASSYADLALRTGGPRFAAFTRGVIVMQWGMLLPYFLIGCVDALIAAFPATLCRLSWSLFVLALLLLPMQLRSFHALSALTTASTISVLLAVLLILVDLVANADPSATTSLWPPLEASWLHGFGACSAFAFAYLGQSIFLELMREMQDSRQFPVALGSANLLMIVAYTATAAVGYACKGEAVAGFLPDALPVGARKTVVGILLAFHTAVCYLICASPFHRAMLLLLSGNVAEHPLPRPLPRSRWLFCTLLSSAAALAVSVAVPFFASVQGLIGSLTGAPILFGWPAFFFLRSTVQRRQPLSRRNLALCAIFIGVCTPVFTVLGTIDSALSIRDTLAGGVYSPLACGDTV